MATVLLTRSGSAATEDARLSFQQNLLHNWHFLNPVNQRGVSGSISAAGYFIDRWKLESGTVEMTDGGLVLNGSMVQILEFPVGQAVTASVLTSTGVTEGSYDDSTKTFTITAAGDTILAAKLELGDTQTLAHEEDGEWVLNEIPDFGEQLAKCQYFARMVNAVLLVRAIGSSSLVFPYNFGSPMRTAPVVERLRCNVYNASGTLQSGFSFSLFSASDQYANISAKKSSHGISDRASMIMEDTVFSADL